MLRRKGIRVKIGLLEDEVATLNEDFSKYISTGFPFTTVKMAMTMDGKIATVGGESRWISGLESRRYVHRMRLQSDAIVVGGRTAKFDDPLLTARTNGGIEKIPWRVIVTSRADIPLKARALRPPGVTRTIIAALREAPRARVARLEAIGARVVLCPSRRGRVSIKSLWRKLGQMGIMSVLIEGGGEVVASALEAGIVDKFAVFIAPKIIGGRDAPTPVGGGGIKRIAKALCLNKFSVRRFGNDLLIEAYLMNHK